MPRLPRLRGREVINVLRRAGFVILHTRDGHHYMQHPDGRRTVVPAHVGETIGPGLLSRILKDSKIKIQVAASMTPFSTIVNVESKDGNRL
jgi:predicted RNA binding protein YcfA (HicA-like mRNA interferase family)